MSRFSPPAIPPNEAHRLAALRDLGILDTEAEAAFDEVVELAASALGAPIALVSLIDENRQWFKARVGLDAEETARSVSFCGHAILTPTELFVVEDATTDDRFADNPLVTGAPDIRAYAGAPLVASDGHALGTLCVIDRVPRSFDSATRATLKLLARQVVLLVELRRASRELHALGEARNRILSMAAHEIRNPLGVIYGYGRRALELSTEPEVQRLLEPVVRRSKQSVELLAELLELAAMDVGKLDIRPAWVDLAATLREELELYTEQARAKGIALVAELPERLAPVFADPRRIQAVLGNLVSNAIKYAPVDGQVEVRVRAREEALELEVHDDGAGIPEVDRARIFEPFVRLAARPTAGEASTGLGMAIVARIVELHGGRIDIGDSPLGGACVRVELPRYGANASEPPSARVG